jgi:arylsulfatase A
MARRRTGMNEMRTTRREFLKRLGAGAAVMTLPAQGRTTKPTSTRQPPNIVIVFTDDQGYADVGVYGAKGVRTPNLDRMASEGVRFTDFYVAQPVCSASRAGLLTGCYPNRIGVTGALTPWDEHGLHESEVTLAELCKSRGYATAVYGKWHLGHRPPFLPTRHGFDEFYGIPYSNSMCPYRPDLAAFPADSIERTRGFPDLPLYDGEHITNPAVSAEDQARFTREFTERAVDFVRRNRQRPFFLYVPHPMPHVPLYVSERFKGRSPQGLYGDVIMELDWSVGQILNVLKEHDLDEDTLVIFTSDNGPWLSYGNHAGLAGPLREGKGSTWEGGVRVPCIMRWPGKIPTGGVCRDPVMTIDIFPTVAGLIRAALPEHGVDGRDIWRLMAGVPGARSPHEALYFYYRQNDLEALRARRWKLVFPHTYRSLTGEPGRDGLPHGYSQEPCGLELYDLDHDIGERHNVIDEHPDVVARLQAYAERARDDLGDALTSREGRNRRPPGRS